MENDNSTVTIKLDKAHTAVAIALILICCMVGGYLIANIIKPPGYHVMYLLDNQNQAVNYIETLIINKNNTFTIPLVVTNNMHATQEYQVQVKIVHNTFIFPVDAPAYKTYEFTLNNEHTWNNQIPLTINEEGKYSIVFELYVKNDVNYSYTDNFCLLHVDVATANTD
ncbi:MAG: DUF1616 domain-containing protein [Candidatus Bathyarchaeota archaeon]|uniref:DUF1616 domain-containing protein n=1 Tax=Candidatus Bathycorpusculum sp. TaxID=2994959 RepID=UPI00281E6DC0|nr:DUF1616 domain-containing protein [Candidatus Termiticorpusculum sp.]MCL2256615.1 DUF1616 domain-containing protein [Candidatus Termiticorpusculum sp.]MCL2293237.1 DUF1616 domain-containing protein [Candidatus Termiticorpusculum sp.]